MISFTSLIILCLLGFGAYVAYISITYKSNEIENEKRSFCKNCGMVTKDGKCERCNKK